MEKESNLKLTIFENKLSIAGLILQRIMPFADVATSLYAPNNKKVEK